MNLSNYTDYALFDYESKVSKDDDFQLGDVVIKELDCNGEPANEIGVIIQVHSKDEFRTDQFGNCTTDELRLATTFEIDSFRPTLYNDSFVERGINR